MLGTYCTFVTQSINNQNIIKNYGNQRQKKNSKRFGIN